MLALSAAFPSLAGAQAGGTATVSINISRNLSTGTRGSDVATIQKFLIGTSNLKIPAPTGYYGSLTSAAVADWQKSQGITPTGTIGPISRGRLSSGVAAPPAVAAAISAPAATVVAPEATSSASTTLSVAPVAGGAIVSGSTGGSSSAGRRISAPPSSTAAFGSVIYTDPGNLSTDNPRNLGIKFAFGSAMDESTINGSNISVTQNGVAVPGTITYSPVGASGSFTPASNFAAGSRIVVTISQNVRTSEGAGLVEDYVFEFYTGSSMSSQGALSLGSAASYGILSNALANASPTIVTGSVGTGPGGQSTSPSVTSGTNNVNNAAYDSAALSFNNALTDADSRICGTTETGGTNLGGRTFTPGVYCFTGPATLTGTTTLSTSGAYIFRFADTFTISPSAAVMVVNGAHPSNVFWVASSTVSVGANSVVLGSVLAKGSVAAGTNAKVDGKIFSRSTVTTSGTTTTAVPGTIYCSAVKPVFATNKAPAPTRMFSVAYIATGTVAFTGELDAHGCDVGIYAAPGSTVSIANANIHDATKVGVFNENGAVNIATSTIAKIGDRDANGEWRFGGTQNAGIGVEFLSTSTGSVINTSFPNYQKIAIVARALDNIFIRNNVITGQGSTTVNAQTGIQIGFGTQTNVLNATNTPNVTGNVITGNIYTLSESAFGILAGMVPGQNASALTAALLSSNTITGNGLVADEDVIVQSF